MPGRIRVATVCQAGLMAGTLEGNRGGVLRLLDRVLEQKPDVVCLPEAFTSPGVPGEPQTTAEPLTGPTVRMCAERAKSAACVVICPIHTCEGGKIYNSAVVLDRDGNVVGAYHKHCPVTTSPDYTVLEGGVTPGTELPVFDLDFGRIGIQICFDIGFPENWLALARKGPQLLFWSSAYDGGFPLRAYAYLHHLWIVSSTRAGRSRIVDPCGEIVAETTDRDPVIVRDLNLDYVVSHLDFNLSVQDRIRERYGDRVAVRAWDPGSAHIVVEPVDPGVRTSEIQEQIGFESTSQYHDRHRAAYAAARAGRKPKPQSARHGRRPQWGKW